MNRNTFSGTDSAKTAPQGRDVVGQAVAQLSRMKEVGLGLRDGIEAYVERQPLVAVGIAAGAGFVLGSLFGSRLGRFALVAAVGYATQEVIDAALGEGGVRRLLAEEASRLAKAPGAPS